VLTRARQWILSGTVIVMRHLKYHTSLIESMDARKYNINKDIAVIVTPTSDVKLH
jgi:hypothetical protein